MNQFLNIVQIISAVLMVIAILLQQRGAGLGGIFGGESGVYRTKRGAEKIIFISTIVLAAIFFACSILNLILFK